jgi:aminoglycoside phosphotransferase (APT) family kinase protein
LDYSLLTVIPESQDYLDHPAAPRPGEELPVPQLEKFLQDYLPDYSGHLKVAQFPRGHSNLTYLLRLGDQEFVLRRPPFGSTVKTAHDMGREYRVLSKLHDAFPPAPRVILFCDDLAVLGAPFYIMERVRGVILRKDPPPGLPFTPEIARRLSESFLDNLARLHSLDFQAIGLGDLGKPQGYLERQVLGWIGRYEVARTHDWPDVDRISKWLAEHIPASPAPTLVHNDYKYDNLVLDPADLSRVIGMLDWEMSTVGDPLTDLGTSLAYWVDRSDPLDWERMRWSPSNYPGSLTRAQLVNRYADITGRDVSDMVYYLVFARLKVAAILQQIYYRYQQGLTKDERFAALPEKIALLMRAAWRAVETETI